MDLDGIRSSARAQRSTPSIRQWACFLKENPPIEHQLQDLYRKLAGGLAWLEHLQTTTQLVLSCEKVDEEVHAATPEREIAQRLYRLADAVELVALNIDQRLKYGVAGAGVATPLTGITRPIKVG
jgi:hypothetical protein